MKQPVKERYGRAESGRAGPGFITDIDFTAKKVPYVIKKIDSNRDFVSLEILI